MSLVKGMSVVSFNVTDWEGAKQFYGETLGMPVRLDLGPEVGWCEFGEEGKTTLAISLWRDETPPPRGGGATPVFDVDDPYAAVEALRNQGVRCDDPVTIPDMVTYASVYDPEGNIFQIARSLNEAIEAQR
jgi:predicted enzyme related to lactoylglutathione lyase